MPDSITVQKQKVQTFLNAQDYVGMYQYIAAQQPNRVGLDNTQQWLLSAAEIARPGAANQNILKQFVYSMNNEASILAGKGPVSLAENQSISNSLATDVGNRYIRFLNGTDTFSPQNLFDSDVFIAVNNLEIPKHHWAGGVLGVAYGFDVLALGSDNIGIFDTQAEIDSWFKLVEITQINHTAELAYAYTGTSISANAGRGLLLSAFSDAVAGNALSPELEGRIANLAMGMPRAMGADILDGINGTLQWLGDQFSYSNSVPQSYLRPANFNPFSSYSYGGILDNSKVQITVEVFDYVGDQPSSSPEGTASQINQNILYIIPTAQVTSTSGIVNGNGYASTEIASDIAGGIRPGNHNTYTDDFSSILADLTAFNPDPFRLQSNTQLSSASLNNFSGQQFNSIYVDPLVLDLNGDGVRMVNFAQATALFDIDHDGLKDVTGWTDGIDGILARDLNSNGVIDDISETFSEYYSGAAGALLGEEGTKPYADGFAALASLDSNIDNVFNASDSAFSSVRVWVDADQDGQTTASELKTLGALGITQINLAKTVQSGLVRDGNEVLASGSFVKNGTTEEALAVRFIANPNGSSFAASGTGTVTTTEGGITSYSAGNGGETVDVAAKGVGNAYGGNGDDVLIGDVNDNWLVGSLGSDSFAGGDGDDVLLIDALDLQANIDGGNGTDIVQVIGSEGVTFDMGAANVEVARGGVGDDVFLVGRNSNGFARGGDGDDVLLGGGASDVLTGEAGNDFINGAGGNDLLRGNAGTDIAFGEDGDDIVDGGSGDDQLGGGTGNDVLIGSQGDDRIDGAVGIDAAQFSGRLAEYRFTTLEGGVLVSDTVSGRDGTDFLANIEKLSFSDIASVDIDLANPIAINDAVQLASRPTSAFTIPISQLLANDLDFQSTAGLSA